MIVILSGLMLVARFSKQSLKNGSEVYSNLMKLLTDQMLSQLVYSTPVSTSPYVTKLSRRHPKNLRDGIKSNPSGVQGIREKE